MVEVTAQRIWRTGALTLLAAIVGNLIVRAIAFAVLPISHAFSPLGLGPVLFWTVVGVIGATYVRTLVARSQQAASIFLRIALVVLVLSFFPDIMLLVYPMFPGTSGPAVGTLMTMHVVAGALSIILLTMPARKAA